MANYTKEEIAAFKKKDQMNCRQSALKAASLIFEGTGCDLANPTKTVLDDAKEYYAWLYPQAEPESNASLPNASLPKASLPTPTAAQKKVLDAIQDVTGFASQDWDIMCKQVLDIAEKDYNIRKYPENLNSVGAFVNKLNNN